MQLLNERIGSSGAVNMKSDRTGSEGLAFNAETLKYAPGFFHADGSFNYLKYAISAAFVAAIGAFLAAGVLFVDGREAAAAVVSVVPVATGTFAFRNLQAELSVRRLKRAFVGQA